MLILAELQECVNINTLLKHSLNKLGAQIILRCPIIPGCNDTIEHFREIENTNIKFKVPEKEEVENWKRIIKV